MKKVKLKSLWLNTVFLTFTFSGTLFAADEINPIALRLEQKQVESMVETMEKSGRITAAEASRAKREIASIQEEDIEIVKALSLSKSNNSQIADNK